MLSVVWYEDVKPGTVAAVLPPSGKSGFNESKPSKRAESRGSQRKGDIALIKPRLKVEPLLDFHSLMYYFFTVQVIFELGFLIIAVEIITPRISKKLAGFVASNRRLQMERRRSPMEDPRYRERKGAGVSR